MARDYVEGLDDPQQFRYSFGGNGKGSILRMSLDKEGMKKIKSLNA
jgi:hypothetical protein